MAKKKKTVEENKINVVRTPDFRRIYSNMAAGGFNAYDFRMLFINELFDSSEDPGEKTGEANTQVVMSHLAVRQLSEWLTKKIDEYEKAFGKIEAPKKDKKKVKP